VESNVVDFEFGEYVTDVVTDLQARIRIMVD
jgi:hypothetical protein